MPLPEIIPSNLPQFVQNKARSHFSNSVIPSGCVLLFAESDGNGGSKLIAKNPDGSFTEVGGGGSMNFYKCASASNGTWTGYLASVDPVTGVWSFASTATTGLAYDRLTPSINKVYDQNCTFEVRSYKQSLPAENLVFYASLDGSTPTIAETGQNINMSGSIAYEDLLGIRCAKNTSSSSYLYTADTDLPTGNSARTFSFWLYLNSTSSTQQWKYFITYGSASNYQRFCVAINNGNKVAVDGWFSANVDTGTLLLSQRWYHIAITYEGSAICFYINGILSSSIANTQLATTLSGYLHIFEGTTSFTTEQNTRMAALRVYDRVLTSEEISALAAEFSPTPAS